MDIIRVYFLCINIFSSFVNSISCSGHVNKSKLASHILTRDAGVRLGFLFYPAIFIKFFSNFLLPHNFLSFMLSDFQNGLATLFYSYRIAVGILGEKAISFFFFFQRKVFPQIFSDLVPIFRN